MTGATRRVSRRAGFSRRMTLKKPRVIGKGVTGCVVRPRFRCTGEAPSKYRIRAKGEVGKIMNQQDAKKEGMYAKYIKELDPESIFTLGAIRVCVPVGSPSDIREELLEQGCNTRRLMRDMNAPVTEVISEYGGIAVGDISPDDIADSIQRAVEGKGDPKKLVVSVLTTEALRLVYGVSRIQKMGRTHFDLHSGNVLFRKSRAESRVIDFVNANTNGFMVPNKNVVKMILDYADIIPRKNYLQFPTELAILAILGTKTGDNYIHPVSLLDPDLPNNIREAIEDGAEGRSAESLRRVLRDYPPGTRYSNVAKALLPEQIPEGDTLFRERCQAVVGMRHLVASEKNMAKRTEIVFRECVRTIDSFAIGNVLHEMLVKVSTGLPRRMRPEQETFGVLLRIVSSLRSPSPAERIRTQTALRSLTSLVSALPRDPRPHLDSLFRVIRSDSNVN